MAKKSKKIKIPKSVLDLRISEKKFAKKNGIRLKGKKMSKKERKRNQKRLRSEYSEFAINGLNKAVKILAENNPEHKKIQKVRDGVDNIISNSRVMKDIVKRYKKHPKNYENLIYLPHMIMTTITYYNSDGISDEEKEIGKEMDQLALTKFCEKILKKQISRYEDRGIPHMIAFQLATVVPTSKIFKNNRSWYRTLIQSMYDMAEQEDVNVNAILKAILKIDKKGGIDKKDFLEGFYTEFMMKRDTNKKHKYTDNQKDLNDELVENTLKYLNSLKPRKLRDILRQYIKRRKAAESYKNDSKRIIKFVDYANSNSEYNVLKSVTQELISDNESNELYLS